MASAAEIQDRRSTVWRLHMEGRSAPEIQEAWAQLCERRGDGEPVTRRTIERDLEWVRTQSRERMQEAHADPTEYVAEVIAEWDHVAQRAMADYGRSMAPRKKGRSVEQPRATNATVGLLRVAIDARREQIKLLQDIGYLRRHLGDLDVGRKLESLTVDELADVLGERKERIRGLVELFELHEDDMPEREM